MSEGHRVKIGRYFRRRVVIVPNDPAVFEVAARIARVIEGRDDRMRVVHVGSTAVRGCAGKGVVDLLLAYPKGRLESAKALLESLGFQRQTTRNAWPESRPMRTGSIRHGGATYRLHVHVVRDGCAEFERMIAFRDRLRADAALRRQYVKVKRAIVARGILDSLDYSDAKAEFFARALRSK